MRNITVFLGGGAAEEQNEVVEERNVNGGKEKGENSSLLRLTDHNIFIILYGVLAIYFAGVMGSLIDNRLFLTLRATCYI